LLTDVTTEINFPLSVSISSIQFVVPISNASTSVSVSKDVLIFKGKFTSKVDDNATVSVGGRDGCELTEGDSVGSILGANEIVGDIDGTSLGVALGVEEGASDTVGVIVGEILGDDDGKSLGLLEGAFVGYGVVVGYALGSALGDVVGVRVGASEGFREGAVDMVG
jgi:hypothetical protein